VIIRTQNAKSDPRCLRMSSGDGARSRPLVADLCWRQQRKALIETVVCQVSQAMRWGVTTSGLVSDPA
jgi:hypothetical protein